MNELLKRPGKYRRAFNWRLNEGQQGGTLEQHSGMIRLASSDFPDILEDFLATSRKRPIRKAREQHAEANACDVNDTADARAVMRIGPFQ